MIFKNVNRRWLEIQNQVGLDLNGKLNSPFLEK